MDPGEIEPSILATFRQAGILTTGHFRLTSGLHSDQYFEKMLIFADPELTEVVCEMLAKMFLHLDVEVVVAPALGGINLSQGVARHLTKLQGKKVLSVFAEKDANGQFVFRSVYRPLLARKRVLLLEDVLTTGGSLKEVAELITTTGGSVLAAGAICNRGEVTAEQIGVPELSSLIALDLLNWEPSKTTCPLCADNVPINNK